LGRLQKSLKDSKNLKKIEVKMKISIIKPRKTHLKGIVKPPETS
jgi:hypothetical protein